MSRANVVSRVVHALTNQLISQRDPAEHPRRLNLGCGFDHRKGYLNVDLNAFHKPDLVADVRQLSMLPSGYYEEIVADDVLEHLPRTETVPTLKEWSRLLRIGGQLRLRVPDLIGLLSLLQSPSHQSVQDQELLVQSLFGTQNYTGDWHQTSFTSLLLKHYLETAGFSNIVFTPKDEWLIAAVATKARNVTVEARNSSVLPEGAHRMEWLTAVAPDAVGGEEMFQVDVLLRNVGTSAWPAREVFLSYHWLEGRKAVVWDGLRTGLGTDWPEGETRRIALNVAAPRGPGEFDLEVTLVHEGVAWFEQHGGKTRTVAVVIK